MSNDTDESDINPHTPKRLRPGSNGGKGSAIVPSASSRLSPPPQKRDDFSPAPEDDSVDPVSPPPKSRSDMGPPPKPNKKAEVTSAPSREALEADASKSKPKSKLEPPEKEMEKNSSGNGKRKGMRMGKAKEKVKQQDFYHIGGSDIVPRRVGLNDFKGSKTVSIREWYEDKATGEMKPGRSGINLKLDEFRTLAKIVPKILKQLDKIEGKITESSSEEGEASQSESEAEPEPKRRKTSSAKPELKRSQSKNVTSSAEASSAETSGSGPMKPKIIKKGTARPVEKQKIKVKAKARNHERTSSSESENEVGSADFVVNDDSGEEDSEEEEYRPKRTTKRTSGLA